MSFLYANVTFSQSSSDVQSYIAKYKSIALQNEKDYGVPATITLAQGILESGAGTSSLTRNTNNHFGIKALGGWNGSVYYAWDDETCKSRFRCYKNAEDSYTDHARLLSTSRFYKHLLCISVYDYRKWAAGLKKAGYATAPNYAKALIGIIDSYKLYAINGGVKLRQARLSLSQPIRSRQNRSLRLIVKCLRQKCRKSKKSFKIQRRDILFVSMTVIAQR